MKKKTILVIGAFDTKASEHAFLAEKIAEQGCDTLFLNIGTLGSTELFSVDITADEVAKAGGESLESIQNKKDRGHAMKVMSQGAPVLVKQLYEEEKIDGIIGMGGSGGTSVITAAMRNLPLGFPKICVSTAASGNTAPFIGTRDIVLIPSIVDVAGLNRISKVVFSRAAGAICGMVQATPPVGEDERPIIAASMFGNTTACVSLCQQMLEKQGYEVLIFHAVGSGGKSMEELVDEGYVKAVLDITTTEWADELCQGVFSAGPDRLSAPGRKGIPHLIVPGCIDMANYTGVDSIPPKFRNRNLYKWNPTVTLMRTNVEENRHMGEIFAQKANAAKGPVGFLIPTKGFSILDSLKEDGTPNLFWDPKADAAFIQALKENLNDDISVVEVETDINDPVFAEKAVDILLNWIKA